MARYIKKSKLKSATPPGTLIYTGEATKQKTEISVIAYNKNEISEEKINSLEELPEASEQTVWININGLHDVSVIEEIGKKYNIHSLILEDILHIGQRPKFEEFPDYLYFVLSMLQYDENNQEVTSEQISILFLENTIITLQEKPGDVFEKIRQRLRNNIGRVRKLKADFLCYVLLDAIVDYYFTILEKVGNRIEDIEDELIEKSNQEMLNRIHNVKSDVIFLRKNIWPVRDLVNNFRNSDSALIDSGMQIFFRDLTDHTAQVFEIVQTYREIVADLLDIYMTGISNKMNEVMKILTIFAAIFIPLTFIAGVYGMNFEFMPELSWKLAYPIWWLVSICIIIGMIYFFKKNKWL